MALSFNINTSEILTLEEFTEFANKKIKWDNIDTLKECVEPFQKLSNNENIVTNELNKMIASYLKGEELDQLGYTAQSVILYQNDDYYIRCNIWPAISKNLQIRNWQDEMFSYLSCHDHNFDFLTVGYLGPGYKTEVWEYDYDKTIGVVGEKVDMRFLETTYLPKGKAMIFRGSKDIHTQYAPEEFSISINVIPQSLKILTNNQYYFNPANKTIDSIVPTASSARNLLFNLAATFHDKETVQLIDEMALKHELPLVRINAFEALEKIHNTVDVWHDAKQDKQLRDQALYRLDQ